MEVGKEACMRHLIVCLPPGLENPWHLLARWVGRTEATNPHTPHQKSPRRKNSEWEGCSNTPPTHVFALGGIRTISSVESLAGGLHGSESHAAAT